MKINLIASNMQNILTSDFDTVNVLGSLATRFIVYALAERVFYASQVKD